MHEAGISKACAQFSRLLTEVGQEKTVIITRRGRRIARLTPEVVEGKAGLAQVMDQIREFRKTMPRFTQEEIQSARREGKKG